MRKRANFFAVFVLLAFGAASRSTYAVNLTVNCDKKETVHKAVKLLANTNPQGPNTVSVAGNCKENITIRSMDRLTLISKKGASITDRSDGSLVVVDIEDSRSVSVQGFTINGGAGGVNCGSASACYLNGDTIQDAVGVGVSVGGGSHAFLEGNVIQNNGFRGSSMSDGSQMFSSNDVFQGNAAQGVVVAFGSYLETSNSSFLTNAVGIEAPVATVRLRGGTISGNGGDGMILLAGSSAIFQGPTITGNGGNGVHLEDGAFAGFLAANITGNLSGTDVDCAPQFPITRFVERTGGITNCVEPPSDSQRKTLE
jgi:hypothetical protein